MKNSDKEKKLKERYSVTKSNYINMKKRLEEENNFYELILIIGSLYLILLGVTDIFFKTYRPNFFDSDLVTYISIVYSIILFAVSLVLKNKNYLDKISTLKTCILELNELITTLSEEEYKEIKEVEKRYNELMKIALVRKDEDYYKTAAAMKDKEIDQEYKKEMENFVSVYKESLGIKIFNIRYLLLTLLLIATTSIVIIF